MGFSDATGRRFAIVCICFHFLCFCQFSPTNTPSQAPGKRVIALLHVDEMQRDPWLAEAIVRVARETVCKGACLAVTFFSGLDVTGFGMAARASNLIKPSNASPKHVFLDYMPEHSDQLALSALAAACQLSVDPRPELAQALPLHFRRLAALFSGWPMGYEMLREMLRKDPKERCKKLYAEWCANLDEPERQKHVESLCAVHGEQLDADATKEFKTMHQKLAAERGRVPLNEYSQLFNDLVEYLSTTDARHAPRTLIRGLNLSDHHVRNLMHLAASPHAVCE